VSGWVGEMKGRMRVNPTEKSNYGRPWFVVFRMHVSRAASVPGTSGGQQLCAGAVPAAVLGLTGEKTETCSLRLEVACAGLEVSP
jgi:hypothetical protein